MCREALLGYSGLVAWTIASTRSDFSSVWGIYLWIGVGVAVFIFGFVGFALVRYRARPGRRPSQREEHNTLEAGAAVLLVCIIAFLVYITFHTESGEDQATSAQPDAVKIDVQAFQWGWRFTYPGEGVTVIGNSNHQPNFAVPVGRPVDFSLTSLDVIHAMWIPEQRFKRDAIPDKVNRFVLEFGAKGFETGHCSEYCGLRHSNMGFGVWVLSNGSYEKWLAAHR
jgi:cytochrome c oxidase subunit 2